MKLQELRKLIREETRKVLREGEEVAAKPAKETPKEEPKQTDKPVKEDQLYVVTWVVRGKGPDGDDVDFEYDTIKAKSAADALAQARKLHSGGFTINKTIEIDNDATARVRAKFEKMNNA